MILQTPNVIKITYLAQTRMVTGLDKLFFMDFFDIFSVFYGFTVLSLILDLFLEYKLDCLKNIKFQYIHSYQN